MTLEGPLGARASAIGMAPGRSRGRGVTVIRVLAN